VATTVTLTVIMALAAAGQAHADSVTTYNWNNLQGKKYRYAGSTIQEGNTRWMFYCGNLHDNVTRDHILLRKATRSGNRWLWSNRESVAVWPGLANTWDHRHVCDPDVVAGEFWYRQPEQARQERYNYALFYTGASVEGGYNQLGWAVAKSLDGPWYKVVGNGADAMTDALVLVGDAPLWGVGQPSATTVQGGRVMLFYTRGDSGDSGGTRTVRRVFNLSDANNPIAEGSELTLTTDGLTQIGGLPDPSNHGGAFMYDWSTDRFWLTRSGHPMPEKVPCRDQVSSHTQLASIPAAYMWNGITDTDGDGVNDVTWTVHRDLQIPGSDLSFDPGFVRNPWGGILQPGKVPMLVSTSALVCDYWLFNYRIHEYTYQ